MDGGEVFTDISKKEGVESIGHEMGIYTEDEMSLTRWMKVNLERGATELFNALDVGIENPLDKFTTQSVNEVMPQSGERQLRSESDCHQQQH